MSSSDGRDDGCYNYNNWRGHLSPPEESKEAALLAPPNGGCPVMRQELSDNDADYCSLGGHPPWRNNSGYPAATAAPEHQGVAQYYGRKRECTTAPRYYGMRSRGMYRAALAHALLEGQPTHRDHNAMGAANRWEQEHQTPPEHSYDGAHRNRRGCGNGHADPIDAFDGNYNKYPPHHHQHPPGGAPPREDPYFDNQTRVDYEEEDSDYYRGTRNDVVFGVGLPVRNHDPRSRRGASSPPPLTISTSSYPSNDDSSSNDSRPSSVGESLDPFDRNTNTAKSAPSGVAGIEVETPPAKRTMIEIVPGVKMLLRGATETWEAFQRKFYVAITCIGCSTNIFCIQDADYVLCPVCRVVSPLEIISKPSQWRVGGLGLGFTTGEQDPLVVSKQTA